LGQFWWCFWPKRKYLGGEFFGGMVLRVKNRKERRRES
jgi:hypothetical protein